MKVGRNDPCPCGSGKKYKKCCLKSGKGKKAGLEDEPEWEPEAVEAMDTEEIVTKLKDFGVDFKTDEFQKDVKRFYSAEEISKQWFKRYNLSATGPDEDFMWMAALVLWERLAPDVMNSERLGGMVQEGYDLREGGKSVEACKLWIEVWSHLKERFTGDMVSISAAEGVFSGMQTIYLWCQELETELWNAGIDDPGFFQKRIDFCQEFCQLFPESDKGIIQTMRRAEAESYFMMGEQEAGDRAFEALVVDYPEWEGVYVGWGGMYADRNEEFSDLKKAEEIYRKGLGKASEVSNLLDRLDDLEKDR